MGDGCCGADFGVFVESSQDFSSHFPPRDEFGEVLFDFFKGFFSQCCCGFGGFCGRVCSACYRGVEFVHEPVDGDVHGTAVGAVDLESGSEGVSLGQPARVH